MRYQFLTQSSWASFKVLPGLGWDAMIKAVIAFISILLNFLKLSGFHLLLTLERFFNNCINLCYYQRNLPLKSPASLVLRFFSRIPFICRMISSNNKAIKSFKGKNKKDFNRDHNFFVKKYRNSSIRKASSKSNLQEQLLTVFY